MIWCNWFCKQLLYCNRFCKNVNDFAMRQAVNEARNDREKLRISIFD